MLEKKITFDQQVLEDGHIQVREITRIIDGGKEIAKTYHRHVVAPGDSPENEDPTTVGLMSVVHDPKTIVEYEALIDEHTKQGTRDSMKLRIIKAVNIHGLEIIKEVIDEIIADLDLIEAHENPDEEAEKKITFMEKLRTWSWGN